LQSHYSYSRCGLGSHGTDRLVALVKQTKKLAQRDGATVFGAKITGGGCGGTVCVLGRAGVRTSDQILKVCNNYSLL
jgi:L-arabinokinase